MVLTVKQAQEAAIKRIQPDVTKLEAKIDEALTRSFDGRNAVSIGLSSENSLAVRQVLEAYKAQGWAATYVSDQRDGNYISIKPKQERNTYVGAYGSGIDQSDR